MGHLASSDQLRVVQRWWQDCQPADATTSLDLPPACAALFPLPAAAVSSGAEPLLPVKLLPATPGSSMRVLKLETPAGVTAAARCSDAASAAALGEQQLTASWSLTCTPSQLHNLELVFAALLVDAPLLLEGMPGIGKTATIMQVASLLGYRWGSRVVAYALPVSDLLGQMPPRAMEPSVFAWRMNCRYLRVTQPLHSCFLSCCLHPTC